MSVETPSVEIKKEILKHQYSTSEEWAAEMASICLCSGFSEENDITVCCPRELVAQRLCEDARKSGKIFPLKEIEKIGRRGGSFYAVTFEKNSFLEFIEPFLTPDTIVEDISENEGVSINELTDMEEKDDDVMIYRPSSETEAEPSGEEDNSTEE